MTDRIREVLVKIEHNSLYQLVWVGVITLLATVLRFYKLGEWSFWIEEHHSIRTAADFSESINNILSSVRPVYYLLLTPVINSLGVSEWSARLVAAVIGIVTIPLLYVATKRLFNVPVALLATLLLAITPWHLYWSQNARFYTLLLLLYNVALFAFYWGLEKDEFKYILVAILAMALGGATHALAALLLPSFLIYYVLLKWLPLARPPGLRLRNLTPIFIAPLAGYILYEAFRLFIARDDPLISIIYTRFFDEATASFVGYRNPYVMVTAVVYAIGTPLAYLTIPGAYYLLKEKRREGLFLVMGAYFPLLAITALTLVASTVNRYVFMSLPAWVILTAVTIRELYQRARTNKWVLLWLLGIPVVLFPDPAIEDTRFFMAQNQSLAVAILLGAIVYLLAVWWFTRSRQKAGQRYALVGALVALGIILAHASIADGLYFAYQGGYRDNWKQATALIRQEKGEKDIVVAAIPPIVAYYLGEEVENVKKIDLDHLPQQSDRVWFVEDFGLDQLMGARFETWAGANCDLAGNWDQFVAGRMWKMRVYRCGPAGSETIG